MPSTIPCFSINSAQHLRTVGISWPEFNKCSPKSHPKTLSFRIPDCFNLRRDGRFKIKLLKKAINFPCFLRTGFTGVKAKDLRKEKRNSEQFRIYSYVLAGQQTFLPNNGRWQWHISWNFIANYMNTMLRKETNLKPPFSSPPHGFCRTGHIYDRYHISNFQIQLISSLKVLFILI